MTREDEISKVHGGGSHVVILGAGASFASTLRNPEKNAKKLPLMKNIVDIVGLNKIINSLPQDYIDLQEDFEKLYSKLANESKFKSEKEEIEKLVYSYFEELDLPDEPTIYDYLVLSLRHKKDLIATFNWDPFLYKAYARNGEFVRGPGINFLHGCVSLGYDAEDDIAGPAGWYNPKTKNEFIPTKLLYPIDKKNYNSDPYIKGQWGSLSEELETAERVTVFGYSAPVSDVEAIELLQKGWGNAEDRNMEQFELIDVRPEDEVKQAWNKFIHSHHYSYSNNYFNSSHALHPRRTVESYHHWALPVTYSEMFQEGNRIPDNFKSVEELWDWHKPLIEAEKQFYGNDYY